MIPVRNWFLLLAFHWRDAAIVDDAFIGGCDFDHPWELAARLLDEALRKLWRRGLEVRFASFDDVGQRPRGAIDLPTTLRERLEERGRLAFRFDDLTTDTPANRVLKAAVLALLRAPGVDDATRTRLRRHLDLLSDVAVVAAAVAGRTAVVPPRHERTYAEALHVARLVLLHQIVDEHARDDTGATAARVPEARRAEVFQGFVRGAARFFCGSRATVTSPILSWSASSLSSRARSLIPDMKLDACLRWRTGETLVIECKFYEQPLARPHHGDQLRFHAAHLYQLTSYLRAVSPRVLDDDDDDDDAIEAAVAGALVYARVDDDLDEEFVLHGWRVRAVALDLAGPWRALRDHVRDLALWPHNATRVIAVDDAPARSI